MTRSIIPCKTQIQISVCIILIESGLSYLYVKVTHYIEIGFLDSIRARVVRERVDNGERARDQPTEELSDLGHDSTR